MSTGTLSQVVALKVHNVISQAMPVGEEYTYNLWLYSSHMNTNKLRQKNRTRGTRRRPRRIRNESTMMIMPAHIRRKLRYVDSAYVRNNPGNNFLIYSFRVNDLYDPDPLILSGSLSGFKELMQFYAQYRVLRITAAVTIVNIETFPLM